MRQVLVRREEEVALHVELLAEGREPADGVVGAVATSIVSIFRREIQTSYYMLLYVQHSNGPIACREVISNPGWYPLQSESGVSGVAPCAAASVCQWPYLGLQIRPLLVRSVPGSCRVPCCRWIRDGSDCLKSPGCAEQSSQWPLKEKDHIVTYFGICLGG